MIPVPPLTEKNEPECFEKNCRACGKAWLAAHPSKDPHEQSKWWSPYQPALAKHFKHRCGWLGTSIQLDGVVEHFLSCGLRQGKSSPHRKLAFEWKNYRYASQAINSRKGIYDDLILDPCEVKDGWFEVLLDGFIMRQTNAIPANLRAKAEFTLDKLDLIRGYNSRWTRWHWYKKYYNNGAPLVDLLREDAPLVASAVEKALEAGEELPNPSEFEPSFDAPIRQRKFAPRPNKKKAKS